MNDISGVLKVGDRQSDKVIVYSNVRNRVIDVQEKLGDLFDRDDNLHKFEVLAIHGQLTKEEKSSYIQMFLDPQHPDLFSGLKCRPRSSILYRKVEELGGFRRQIP